MDLQPLLEALRRRTDEVGTLDVNGVTHIIAPQGVSVTPAEIERHLPAPKAIRRSVQAHDMRGLVDYVNKFKGDATQLYAGPLAAPYLLARIDDHLRDAPSHIHHTATYSCPRTAEWETWTQQDKKSVEQRDFADFLERNLRDIDQPSGAEMLQMVSNFRDASTANFESAVNRTNGRVQFQYVQKDQAAGQVSLPEKFRVAIPVFEGMTETDEATGKQVAIRYPVTARLRWRIREQTLHLWYELDRADVVFRIAFDDLVERVEKQTGIHVFRAI
jgi:uncharacterized protein YfdQ (DUF2303 family)